MYSKKYFKDTALRHLLTNSNNSAVAVLVVGCDAESFGVTTNGEKTLSSSGHQS